MKPLNIAKFAFLTIFMGNALAAEITSCTTPPPEVSPPAETIMHLANETVMDISFSLQFKITDPTVPLGAPSFINPFSCDLPPMSTYDFLKSHSPVLKLFSDLTIPEGSDVQAILCFQIIGTPSMPIIFSLKSHPLPKTLKICPPDPDAHIGPNSPFTILLENCCI